MHESLRKRTRPSKHRAQGTAIALASRLPSLRSTLARLRSCPPAFPSPVSLPFPFSPSLPSPVADPFRSLLPLRRRLRPHTRSTRACDTYQSSIDIDVLPASIQHASRTSPFCFSLAPALYLSPPAPPTRSSTPCSPRSASSTPFAPIKTVASPLLVPTFAPASLRTHRHSEVYLNPIRHAQVLCGRPWRCV